MFLRVFLHAHTCSSSLLAPPQVAEHRAAAERDFQRSRSESLTSALETYRSDAAHSQRAASEAEASLVQHQAALARAQAETTAARDGARRHEADARKALVDKEIAVSSEVGGSGIEGKEWRVDRRRIIAVATPPHDGEELTANRLSSEARHAAETASLRRELDAQKLLLDAVQRLETGLSSKVVIGRQSSVVLRRRSNQPPLSPMSRSRLERSAVRTVRTRVVARHRT